MTSPKQQEVESILKQLSDESGSGSESSLSLFQRLKILGREPKGAEALFTENGVQILGKYALNDSSPLEVSREALRCLANSMLLQPKTRQIYADFDFPTKTVARYIKFQEPDDEFLYSRILFLLTYDTKFDFEKLFQDHSLAQGVQGCLARHAERLQSSDSSQKKPRSAMEVMALSEASKLLYNLIAHYPAQESRFNSAPQWITTLLKQERPFSGKSMEPLVGPLINALLPLDLEKASEALFPADAPSSTVDCVIEALSTAVKSYTAPEMDAAAAPSVTLLRKIYDIAPAAVQSSMREQILPSDEERTKPLGQSDTLASRLLRLSTSGHAPLLREEIPKMLFEMSDKDAATFVRNVGYGYASGFLTNNNLPVPPVPRQSSADASSSEDAINFVTGQFTRDEPSPQEPPMTEEEKMREAEKLFVLFERLKRTGVMDVQNPVEEAIQSGRFEELD